MMKAGSTFPKSSEADLTAARLSAIVESSDDAIISKNLNSIVTTWNKGAEKIFGYTAGEMIGISITRLIPADRKDEEAHILGRIRKGEKVEHFETLRQTKDGSVIPVSITASPIKDGDGTIVGVSKIARDITLQKRHENELIRLTRLYAALSQVNQAIVWSPTREELYRKVCRVLVEHGGFHVAWIGWHDPQTHRLMPLAIWGDEKDYIESIEVYADDRPEGLGPSGQAFRTGRPSICNDLLSDPATLPWREELLRRDLKAAAVFPVRLKAEVRGILAVYSNEPGFFQDKETDLLAEAAGDISFALDNFAEKEARKQEETIAENERHFSATMIESMPGIVYFYDDQGRFVRWNRNFEIVSGYSGEEISRMHPLDFFADHEKESLRERIASVFETGEAFIEASFVARDGTATPYFFTGRRVVFEGRICLLGMGVDISERKRAEGELRESLARFHAAAQATNDVIWDWNLATGSIWWNDNFQTSFGYECQEIESGIESWINRLHPNDRDRVVAGIHAVIDGVGDAWTDEYRLRRGDGSYAEVFDRGHVLRDAAGQALRMVGAIQDITDRKRAEGMLRASEGRYRTLFEHAPDGIVIANAEAYYVDANASICHMLGYEREEFLRLHSSDIVLPEEVSRIDTALQAIHTQPNYHREWQFRRKDGSIFPAEVIATVMPDGNILALIRDITDRRKAEEALRELNSNLEDKVAARTEELQTALVRAEAADRIKSAFLATMSHELRTPLNSIIGFTGIVIQGLAGPLNPEQTKQLGMVRSSARHLLDLINDVLDISKIEAGQLEVRAETFNLRESLERVATLVQPLAEKKGLELTLAAPPELGEMVSDKRRVEQILINLVTNAIKFTDQGRVTVIAEVVAAHEFSPESSPRRAVRLRVEDSGIGITPEDLATLFQPFRQLDSGLSRQHEGTGLGLAICRRLATLLDGEISATSELAKGSVFTVILPLRLPTTP